MAGRIISLTLRAENQVSTIRHMEYDALHIRGVGESIFEDKDELYDAQITKATGFDAPEFDVQGGALYSGGSQFNGFRAHDRELVLTMLPVPRLAPSDVKNRIARMISMSNMHPLSLTVYYATEDVRARYTADVYVSNITSPIFTQSREVQVTLKMGSVSFTGPTMPVSATVTPESNRLGFSDMVRSVAPHGFQLQSRHLYLSDDVLLHSNAPFVAAGTFWLTIPKANLDAVSSIDIANGRGDSVGLVPTPETQSRFERMFPGATEYTFGVMFDGASRQMYLITSRNSGRTDIKDSPFSMITRVRWPLGMPVKTALSVQVRTKRLVDKSLFDKDILARFAPERYGF